MKMPRDTSSHSRSTGSRNRYLNNDNKNRSKYDRERNISYRRERSSRLHHRSIAKCEKTEKKYKRESSRSRSRHGRKSSTTRYSSNETSYRKYSPSRYDHSPCKNHHSRSKSVSSLSTKSYSRSNSPSSYSPNHKSRSSKYKHRKHKEPVRKRSRSKTSSSRSSETTNKDSYRSVVSIKDEVINEDAIEPSTSPKNKNLSNEDNYNHIIKNEGTSYEGNENTWGSDSVEKCYDRDEPLDKEKIHREMEQKLRSVLAKEGKVYPPPKAGASHPIFANDGSFLETFKRIQEVIQQQSQNPECETKKKAPVCKRRGGKILKTGVVAKMQPMNSHNMNDPKDVWSVYLQEVKKYQNTACDVDSKTRPLVK